MGTQDSARPRPTNMPRIRIPASISATVYRIGWWWTLMVWAIAACSFVAMMSVDWTAVPLRDGFGWLADVMPGLGFAASSCVGFVGAMPLVPGEHNRLHWSFGIAACVLSQLWTLLSVVSRPPCSAAASLAALALLLTALLAAAVLTRSLRRSWCFWLELWCILSPAVVRVYL